MYQNEHLIITSIVNDNFKPPVKADKRLERERAEKAEQERQDREEELREMAIRLRRRC